MVIVICALLAACGGRMSKKQSLDHSLYQYAKVIRWGQFENALNFFDPKTPNEEMPKRLDVDRLKQFGVSSYVASPILPGANDNSIIQDVQIKMYNLHTKREKVVVDRQVWEYDEDTHKWWLTSGLPKITN